MQSTNAQTQTSTTTRSIRPRPTWYLPFPTSGVMQATQMTHHNLRVLRTNEDDLSEAAYRRSIYAAYDSAVGVLTCTTTVTTTATNSFGAHLAPPIDHLTHYTNHLSYMQHRTGFLARGQCLSGVRALTAPLGRDVRFVFVVGLPELLRRVAHVLREVRSARDQLADTMDASEADGLLDYNECERLLGELGKREEEIGACLETMRLGVQEVQAWVREECWAAAEFLEQGKLRGLGGVEELAEELEVLGDGVWEYDFSAGVFWPEGEGEPDSGFGE